MHGQALELVETLFDNGDIENPLFENVAAKIKGYEINEAFTWQPARPTRAVQRLQASFPQCLPSTASRRPEDQANGFLNSTKPKTPRDHRSRSLRR